MNDTTPAEEFAAIIGPTVPEPNPEPPEPLPHKPRPDSSQGSGYDATSPIIDPLQALADALLKPATGNPWHDLHTHRTI